MQIACPQCSTTYELDPRLLPAEGAPVQCTRCHHVFLAHPHGEGTHAQGTAAEPAPARKATQLFGSAAPDQPPARKSTQLFGAVTAPPAPGPAPAAAPRASTQRLGAVMLPPEPGAEPSAPPRTRTQLFGTELLGTGGAPAEPHAPAPRASTQLFGAVTPPSEPAPVVPPSPPRASTQLFGVAPPAVAPATVAPGAGVPPGAPVGRTVVPAGPGAGGSAPSHLPGGSTGTPAAPAPEVREPAGTEPPRRPTQLFGAAAQPTEPTVGTPPSEPVPRPERTSTRPYGTGLPAPVEPPPPGGAPGTRGPERTAGGRVRLELPIEPVDLLPPGGPGPVGEGGGGSAISRTTVLKLAGGLLAAVLVLAGGARLFGPRPYHPPAEVQLAHGDAARLLSRDDMASRHTALEALEGLVKAHPPLVEARADLALGLALALDDARLMQRELQAARAELAGQVASLEAARAPSDWQNRVHVLREELQQVQRRLQPVADEVLATERRLGQALAELRAVPAETLTPLQQQARVRAEAMAAAIEGQVDALALVERYRQSALRDGWDDVAYAEFVANSAAARASAEQAREGLGALRAQDSSRVRLFLLEARLARVAGDTQAARNALESALSLNPEHTLARLLLERTPAHEQ